MTILSWIGKEVVVNHDKDVPFRLLKKSKSKSVNDSENLIIEGDNLEALKALLPHYQNKIKCVFIDPPYNTGNEHWRYSDNVNSPTIKKWLDILRLADGGIEYLKEHYDKTGNNIDPSILIKSVENLIDGKIKEIKS